MIRGIDFYNYAFGLISQQSNFEIATGEISLLKNENEFGSVIINGKEVKAQYIFNSIIFQQPVLRSNEYYLLQHFKGWIIETEQDVFDKNVAVLMDFRVAQTHGTTFVYVMPFEKNKALVEYTLFSHDELTQKEYDDALKKYIKEFVTAQGYKISEEEYGVIPMTNHRFAVNNGNIINIGTAGGQTKASSGYTFQFIQNQSAAITHQLVNGNSAAVKTKALLKRFNFYDSTLLNILHHKKLEGRKIFSQLFKKNKPQHVLRFLDNDSSFIEELQIISSLPTGVFLKAALQQL